MIFYCGKVVLFAFLVALTFAAAQDNSEPAEITPSIKKTLHDWDASPILIIPNTAQILTPTTTSLSSSLTYEFQSPLQNTVLQAALGIGFGAVGIAACAAGFYLFLRRKKDKGEDDGGGGDEGGLPPMKRLNPLVNLIPSDTIKGDVGADDAGVGPGSTVIDLPEVIETPRKNERESIVVTQHGAAKDVDPSKLEIPPQEIHGTHHISSSSVDLSQGQGPSGNDFE